VDLSDSKDILGKKHAQKGAVERVSLKELMIVPLTEYLERKGVK